MAIGAARAPEQEARLDRAALADRVRSAAASFGILVIAGALLAAFSLTSDVFLSAGNIRNILMQTSVVGVAAIGETIVLLAGGLDLSVGGVVLLSEVLVADLTTTHHLSIAIALPVALAASSGIGLMNGFLTAIISIEPILATLGTLLVAGGIGELVLNLRYIQVTDPIFDSLATTNVIFNLPILVAVMFGLYFAVALAMQKTPFGRAVYAIGGNRRAARLSGLSVVRVTIGVYLLGGLFSGIAGFLNMGQLGLVSQSDGTGMQFSAIIAALVGGLSLTAGGVGRVERTLLGALIVGMMTNYQTVKGVDPAFQQALLGGLLVAAVIADRVLRGRQA